MARPMRLRSTDPRFMAKVRNYFQVLLPKLVPLQITHGGPVIMVQVENEVGTYGYARDYGPKAEAQFNGPVPAEVLKRKKSPVALAAKANATG